MSHVFSTKPALYRGLTLSERMRDHHPAGSVHAPSGAPIEMSKFSRWRSAFTEHSVFARRLATAGIDEAALRDILAERPEDLRERFGETPRWMTECEDALRDAPGFAGETAAHSERANDPSEFARAFEPLLARGRARLRAGLTNVLARYPRFAYLQSATAVLETALLGRVSSIAARTLVLELNVARLQGTLTGETPEGRFADFVRRLEQPEMRASLVCDYPVLARQIVMRVEQWVATSLEFIDRLCSDWEILREALFAGHDPGPLVGFETGQGDSHRGGRSVAIARFASGAAVVYKPHSLAVDVHFNELLHWLNARGSHVAFRNLSIIDRGSYGWEEFVARSACDAPEQVERFYQRCGAYLAILYALRATDFHFENLIAAGEHPVLVDLEALFHPRFPSGDESDAGDVAVRVIGSSVLGIGLLPYQVRSGPDSAGLDLSGLGGKPDQLTPYDVPILGRVGTDRMAIEPGRIPVGGSTHRPSLRGTDIDAATYAESIARGFSLMYGLLRDRRDELLAPGGPLESFARDETRVIIRPTQTYAILLATSFHPDLLHDALDREIFLDRLWAIAHVRGLECAIPDECEDLQCGDIPLFTTSPQSRDLLTSSGRRIDGVLTESGLATVRGQIAQLGEDDLAAQLWYVRASLGSEVRREPNGGYRLPARPVDREGLLAGALTIGERLERLALHGDAGVAWIGASPVDEQRVDIAPLGPDLYDGLPGVALFLAQLGTITGETRYAELARRALITLRAQIARSALSGIGALSGWGGVVYALAHLGDLWAEPELFEEAAGFAERAADLIGADCSFDVVGGAAGCVVALLALDACTSSESVRGIAQRCGEHLLANIVPCATGAGWIAAGTGGVPLTGFSHGAAGIALALLRLSAATRDDRFREAALAAIAYERSLFSHAAQNWPDLRAPSRHASGAAIDEACQTLWCHGAPGIGLARLASREFLDDPVVDAEIDIALQTTCRDGFAGGHSLCHGTLGNLELLLVAAQRRESPELKTRVEELAAAVLEDADQNGWRCGNRAAVETPGLMTGLAGIGYQLLRLAEPARVPSVLSFARPIGVLRTAHVGR